MVAPSATIVVGDAVRVEVVALAAAGLTVTVLLVPDELPSPTLIVWLPAVLSVAVKVWLPLSPARNVYAAGSAACGSLEPKLTAPV